MDRSMAMSTAVVFVSLFCMTTAANVSTAALPQAATAAAGPASDVFGLFEQAYDPESYGLSANISGFDDYDISSFACLSIFTALESFEFISTNLTFEVFVDLLNATATAFPNSKAAQLVAGNGNYSVLAPTDNAFSNVSIASLLANKELLNKTMNTHIIELPYNAGSLDQVDDFVANITGIIGQPLIPEERIFDVSSVAASGVGLISNASLYEGDYGLDPYPLIPEPTLVYTPICGGGVALPLAVPLKTT